MCIITIVFSGNLLVLVIFAFGKIILTMNIKVISRNVGLALLTNALFMLLSMLVSVFNGMDSAFGPLLISFVITFLVGSFPFIFVRKEEAISLKDGYMIIVLSWLLCFLFGSLPYVLWGGEFTVINAWFESVSGYTTTGSTILTNVEVLPNSLLFWRSSTHFIGGLGVVVFLLLILPSASPFRFKLTNIELSSLSREGFKYRSGRTVRIMVLVYVGLVVVEAVLLWLAGMTIFDAVNHAFSTIATGGFSTKNLSVAYYDSNAINVIIIIFMILSAIHFGSIFAIFATKSLGAFFKKPVIKYYFGCIIAMSFIVLFSLKFQGGYETWSKAAMDSVFLVVSYFSATGFAIADNANWPFLACLVLAFAAIQCGCSGSTTGGIKTDRMLIAFSTLGRQIKKSLYPSSITQIRVGGQTVHDDVALPIILYIFIYIFILFISTIILVAIGVSPMDAFSGTFASMGNVGPGFGAIGSMGNFNSQPAVAKVIYTIVMILGRMEIYPIFIVIGLIFTRKR